MTTKARTADVRCARSSNFSNRSTPHATQRLKDLSILRPTNRFSHRHPDCSELINTLQTWKPVISLICVCLQKLISTCRLYDHRISIFRHRIRATGWTSTSLEPVLVNTLPTSTRTSSVSITLYELLVSEPNTVPWYGNSPRDLEERSEWFILHA
jgi:hypothetical protein